MKNINKDGKKKDSEQFKGEIKYKPDWMLKRPSESQLNTPNTWNGGIWYYCHRDTGGKFYGQYHKKNPS